MNSIAFGAVIASTLLLARPALATETPAGSAAQPKSQASPKAEVKKCEHGVKNTICTRCKPKLAAAFKAKGDWCAEHNRAESQCAICKPALKKDGIKP